MLRVVFRRGWRTWEAPLLGADLLAVVAAAGGEVHLRVVREQEGCCFRVFPCFFHRHASLMNAVSAQVAAIFKSKVERLMR